MKSKEYFNLIQEDWLLVC